MKKLTILLAMLSMILVGCDKENQEIPTPTPAPPPAPVDASVYFFPTTEELDIEMDPAEPFTKWEIEVSRYDVTDLYPASTVDISVQKNTNSAYSVPATLAFAEGEKKATLTVAIGTLTPGVNNELTISVAGENTDLDITQLGEGVDPETAGFTYSLSIFPTAMTEVRTGVWIEGWIDDWFGSGRVAFYVKYQIESRAGGKQIIHAKDVYARVPSSEDPDEYGIYDAFPLIAAKELVPGTYDLTINIDRDGNAFLEQSELGFDWGYGNMVVRSTNTPGTWDGEHLYFSGENKTTVTKLPEYNDAFYYCDKDVEFFTSREALLKRINKSKSEAPKCYIKQTRQIRR